MVERERLLAADATVSKTSATNTVLEWIKRDHHQLAAKLAEVATSRVMYSYDAVECRFQVELPARPDYAVMEDFKHWCSRNGLYHTEHFPGHGVTMLTCTVKPDAPSPVAEAAQAMSAGAKARSGYDAKSAAADALVPVVQAYVSGMPPPACTAALKESLAARLPPDLVDRVANLARGTLEDDIWREAATYPRNMTYLYVEHPVPMPGVAAEDAWDIVDLAVYRINSDRGGGGLERDGYYVSASRADPGSINVAFNIGLLAKPCPM